MHMQQYNICCIQEMILWWKIFQHKYLLILKNFSTQIFIKSQEFSNTNIY